MQWHFGLEAGAAELRGCLMIVEWALEPLPKSLACRARAEAGVSLAAKCVAREPATLSPTAVLPGQGAASCWRGLALARGRAEQQTRWMRPRGHRGKRARWWGLCLCRLLAAIHLQACSCAFLQHRCCCCCCYCCCSWPEAAPRTAEGSWSAPRRQCQRHQAPQLPQDPRHCRRCRC